MGASGVQVEELLLHADFLRRLAGELVGREGEDLVQEVWLRALRRPPRSGERLKAWLATTAKNLVANRRRDEGRRLSRERNAPSRDAGPSSEEILAREETRANLVRAVLALEDPLREALLLRYYEGLPPR